MVMLRCCDGLQDRNRRRARNRPPCRPPPVDMRSGTSCLWPGGARPWLFPMLALALLFCTGADVVKHDPVIEAIQRKLAEKGFDPGPVDGTTGWRTRSALRRFQRSSGLPDTGQVDDATRKALGVELPAAPEPGPETQKADAARAGPAPGAGKRLPKTEAPRPEPAPTEAATNGPEAKNAFPSRAGAGTSSGAGVELRDARLASAPDRCGSTGPLQRKQHVSRDQTRRGCAGRAGEQVRLRAGNGGANPRIRLRIRARDDFPSNSSSA